MKIALVTNKNLHHKYWAYEMSIRHDVKMIIHPNKKTNLIESFRKKSFMKYGFFYFLMKILSLLYNKIIRQSMSQQLDLYEKLFFENYSDKYNEIPKEIIHEVETVNEREIVNLVKAKEIDIICFLGGDLAKEDFINASKVASLNYHSGISPYYNGNKTIFHAVSDNRPNFAGGTLMYISTRVDGGGILSHFFPRIQSSDNAASLFMKGIKGAVILYSEFIEYIQDHELPNGVVQEKSFKYVRNIDWNIINDLKLKKYSKNGIGKFHWRNEKVLSYFNLDKRDIVKIYSTSLNTILKK